MDSEIESIPILEYDSSNSNEELIVENSDRGSHGGIRALLYLRWTWLVQFPKMDAIRMTNAKGLGFSVSLVSQLRS